MSPALRVARRLVAFALVAPLLVAVAAPSEARPTLSPCQVDCNKVQRRCDQKCLDEAATCRQPCGCPDAPKACTPSQRQCHGACSTRLIGCENVCRKDVDRCEKKC